MFKRLLACVLLLPTMAMATELEFGDNQCEVNLNYDVNVSSERLQVIEQQQTLYEFDGTVLRVGEQTITLTDEQRLQLERFQQQLLQGSSDIVALATEAIIMATEVLAEIYTELNIDSNTPEQLMMALQQQLDTAISADHGSYHLASQSLESATTEMEAVIETHVEKIATEGIGQLFMSMGKAMSDGEGSFEQRMTDFGQSMEQMGERIEQRVEQSSTKMEAQGQRLCEQWQRLDLQEQRVRDLVPQLQQYNLVTAEQNKLAFLR
ncbi:DUF2884 family protein [Ferrimonas lipolytica]|uniref:YggN family protein n=1 Tax=Ferrimonas lipolytica TaxID=2724191 RepID=A0A6H1U9K9_9GAMM|nr:DUF2884 family protein [Ferrimonas lipolytica]QIZ75714.1 YggN family protein [Ferrimonas lipolytica]